MRTIAVIDHDADSRLLARAVLGAEYVVIEYDSAESAAAGLGILLPDVVLLEVALPGADGLSLLDWLRAAPHMRHVPVIAFTAGAQNGAAARFRRAGFDACVAKPLADEADLLHAVQRLLDPVAAR